MSQARSAQQHSWHVLATDAFELFQTLQVSDADAKKIDKVIDALTKHFVGETNVTYERYVFNRRMQESGELFDIFFADLRKLVRTCDYGTLEDSILRDRIVVGVRDDANRKKLLQTRNLDLKQAIDICKASEAASKQLRDMSESGKADVQAVQSRRSGKSATRTRDTHTRTRDTERNTSDRRERKRSKSRDEPLCDYCNRRHKREKGSCPAFGKSCHKCRGKNHFSVACKQKVVNAADASDDDDECDEDDGGTVYALNNAGDKRVYSRLEIDGRPIRFLLDSGATVNLLPCGLADQLKLSVKSTRTKLRMYDGTVLKTSGETETCVKHPLTGQRETLKFHVTTVHKQPLIGSDACLLFDLIQVNRSNICSVSVQKQSETVSAADVTTRYADLFQGIGCMPGEVHLEADSKVPPVRLPLRKLPVPIKERVGSELRRLESEGIIERVTGPTSWLSALLVVNKPNGDIRICVDPKPLNKALQRDHFCMPTIDDVLPMLSNAKIFSTVDASNAFWHCKLDAESSDLTAFETPFGKYKWLRMPYGVSPAPEIFQRKMLESLSGLSGIACIADDILIYGCGSSVDEARTDHDRNLIAVLDRCREQNIRLNRDKMKLHRPTVKFMGHELTSNGIRTDPGKVKAIDDMPQPVDKPGVHRFLGMATYLARYIPQFSEITAPLRELLKENNDFTWDDHVHGKAFRALKTHISSARVLAYYDVTKPVTVQCDSSQSGLGAALLQDGKPVEFASKALTETEQRYAQIEKELLAIVFAMERFHTYVYGRNVTIETDHKPLITIVKKPLTSAPKRLQRMLLRLQRYNFELEYKPGSQVIIADTLSRAYPVGPATATRFAEQLAAIETEVESELRLIASEATITKMRTAASTDDEYQLLRKQLLTGWPESTSDLPQCLREYNTYADELTVSGDFVFKGSAVVVPQDTRPFLLERIHSSHIGVNGCIRRAREALFWPGMTKQIQDKIAHCTVCLEHESNSCKEPLKSHPVPTRAWEKVGVDIFTFRERDYLITVDYLSGYFEVDRLKSKKVRDIVYVLKQQFARHGIPEVVFTDNSPFGSVEFRAFAANYEFRHDTSSPRYPQSNGRVENAVKTAKRLMTKSVESGADPFLALLDWRNTPSEQLGKSPAQLMFARNTRTRLPCEQKLLGVCDLSVRRKAEAAKEKQAEYYDRTAKPRKTLTEGQTVRFQDADGTIWRKGEIVKVLPHRSYEVKTEEGSTTTKDI